MTTWEVILLMAGFACLCISYFVSRNSSENETENGEAQGASAVWTEKEEELIRERVGELLQEMQNEFAEQATDEMNRLCNDKIMAIDEFSQQLFEKIKSNHREVVFMYNMLTEKQKEISSIVTKPVAPKPVKKEAVKPAAVPEKKKEIPQKPAAEPKQTVLRQKKPAVEATAAAETAAKRGQAVRKRQAAPGKTAPAEDINQQIQKMYREGKSVLEISKALNMGQGEVKLVITLYGGKGR